MSNLYEQGVHNKVASECPSSDTFIIITDEILLHVLWSHTEMGK